jgi:serine/threonine-protein kinase
MPARQDRTVTTADSTPPEEFGPYVVYERLGVGGMATVHRAKKRGIAGFERVVALKRMLPHLAEDAEFINSFVREAKLASLLVHPNIAQIYDFGRVGSIYFIAMELVDGFDVRKMLRYSNRHKDPLPLQVVLSILCELCDALDHAHTFVDEHGVAQGIVHRDVSPSNLIVAQSGHLKVIDFGIAKANARQLHTESGRIKGKLGYMSPEAVTGRAFGPVSDVFSAGVVAHELLTAHPLFSAKTDYDTLIRIHEAEIAPPSRRNPSVPAALDEVVLAALARDPERRIPTARAFREALEYVADRAGMRFSARDVADWRARIATTEDPWGSRTSLPNVSSSAVSRAFPESRNSLSGVHPRPQRSISVAPPLRGPQVTRLGSTGLPLPADVGGAMSDAEDDKSVADLTWGLDPAQASPIHPLPDSAQPAAPVAVQPTLPMAPMIGASIQGPRRNLAARFAVVALFAIAAGLAAYQFVLRPKRPVAVPPPPPALSTIKFLVEPIDAAVQIAGNEVGHHSPFETQLEPGVYSVSVRRPGYKSWTTEVTLRSAESQTVHVALEPALAHLSVTSQPPGLVAQLDGQALTQVTPLELSISVGNHQLVVSNAAGLEWSQDFTAEADRQYPFHASFAAGKKSTAGAASAAAAATSPHSAAPPTPPDRNKRAGSASQARIAKDAGTDGEVRITEGDTEPAPPPIKPVVKLDAGPPPPIVAEPPRPAIAPGPRAVPLIAATAVTKLSGALPAFKVEGLSDSFADVLGKVCIDERGHVTSVKIIKALPEIAEELKTTIETWRYQPYSNASGQPSPACFAVSLHVIFKRAK